MPLLLSTLFGNLAAWFAQYVTRKAALGLTAVATFAILTTALAVAIQSLLAGIVYSIPSVIANYGAMVIPSNFSVCISAYFSALIARWAYDWNVANLKILSSVS